MRYKLIAGVAQVPDFSVTLTEEQKAAKMKQPSKLLKTGDIYETDVDMVAKHGGDKWQLVGPSRAKAAEAVTITADNFASVPELNTLVGQPASLAGEKPPMNKQEYFAQLDKMSTKELIALADDQEIELAGKTARQEVLKALKASVDE